MELAKNVLNRNQLIKLLEHQIAVRDIREPIIMEISERDAINLGFLCDTKNSDARMDSETGELEESLLPRHDTQASKTGTTLETSPVIIKSEVVEKETNEECSSDQNCKKVKKRKRGGKKHVVDFVEKPQEKVIQKSEFVIHIKGDPYRYISYSNAHSCKQKLLQCKACQECFNSKRSLLEHFKNQTKDQRCLYHKENPDLKTLEKIFQCNVCNKLFSEETRLIAHSKLHDEIQNEPESRSNHSKFKLINGNPPPPSPIVQDIYVCETCHKCFVDEKVLVKHRRYHSKDRPHKCGECDKSFARFGDLKRHKLTHIGEKPFTCHVCNFSFTRQADLQRHFQTHTGYKPYECQLCSQCFGRQADLNRHQLIHSSEKAFKCKTCGKGFHRENDMDRHSLKHTGRRPYHCSECPKSFIHDNDLKRHMVRHNQPRPYPCDKCAKSYSEQADLTRHKLKHSQDKIYSCFVCNKNFCYQSDLSRHFITHTGQKPFECDVCKKCFGRRFDVIRHRRKHRWYEMRSANAKQESEVD